MPIPLFLLHSLNPWTSPPSPASLLLCSGRYPVSRLYSVGTFGNSQYKRNINFIYAVIAVNTVICLWWQLALPKGRLVQLSYGGYQVKLLYAHPGLYSFLRKHCLLSPSQLRNSYYRSILASSFSHIDIGHLVSNMVSTWAFGSTLAEIPGVQRKELLNLTVGSAIFGSLGFLVHQSFGIFSKRWMLYPSETWTYVRTGIAALGASGVVIGFGAATACLVPEMEFFLFGVVPVPLWLTGQGYFVWDAFHLSNPYSAVGHASHVAGGACGVLYYLWELKKLGGIYYGL